MPDLGVISSEDVPLGGHRDDELSHKQEGITVNCSQIAIVHSPGPHTHVTRDK